MAMAITTFKKERKKKKEKRKRKRENTEMLRDYFPYGCVHPKPNSNEIL